MLPERHGSSLNRREFLVVGGVVVGGFGPVDGAALLDADFKVVWDLDKAYRETTATRERVKTTTAAKWKVG